MKYNWHSIWKKVFIDGHKQSNVVDYYYQFLGEIKAIKAYLVKFKEDSFIKSRINLKNYAIGGLNCYLIIFIIYDKSSYNVNNNYQ